MTRRITLGLFALFFCANSFAATLAELAGSVEVSHAQSSFEAVSSTSLPMNLEDKAVIRTAASGRAKILFEDGTEVNLGSSSSFEIGEPTESEKGGGALFSVLGGRVRVLVNSLTRKNQWRMRAGNAAMGVRGTEFIVLYTKTGFQLCAFRGTVALQDSRAPAKSVDILENEGVSISPTGDISTPVAMDSYQMVWWRQETSLSSSAQDDYALKLLGQDWFWTGPTAVDSLNPQAPPPQLLGGDLWFRFFHETSASPRRDDETGRLTLNGALPYHEHYLLYLEGIFSEKSGDTNPETAGEIFQQGFVMARTTQGHSLALGRQEWEFGDGLVVGKDPWFAVNRHFDGALLTLRSPYLRIRGAITSIGDRVSPLRGEDWLGAIYADFSKLPIQLYGFWEKRNGSFITDTYNLGEKIELDFAKYSVLPIFLKEEWVYQLQSYLGENPSSYLGTVDVGVRKNFGALANALGASFLWVGDFLPLFPDSHRFLGLLNLFNERDIEKQAAFLQQSTPIRGHRFSWELTYAHFNQTQSSSSLGNEWDALLGFEPDPRVFLQLGYGYFIPDAAFGSSTNIQNIFAMGQVKLP